MAMVETKADELLVVAAMSELGAIMSELEKAVATMEERLRPVLLLSTECLVPAGPAMSSCECALAKEIFNAAGAANWLHGRLAQLIQDLQV